MNAQLMFCDERSISILASSRARRYGSPQVMAKSMAGCRNPSENLAHRRPHSDCWRLFLRPQLSVMAAVCGQASAWPGSKFPGIPTPRTAATQSRRKDRGSSDIELGAPPMSALIPSKIRALAHRRMALSALRADSSLSTRLARYNAHMAIVRTLESVGGAA